MTQVRTQPGLVDDADIIDNMKPHEIKELAPPSLNENQLFAAYRKLDTYGFRERAFAMLLELKARPEQEEFACGHMGDLLERAIDTGKTALARRVMEEIPAKFLPSPEKTRLRLVIMEKSDGYKELEEMARRGIVMGDEETKWDDPLLALSYTFENKLPALSIACARAFMLGNPEKTFDNEMLLDVIRTGRAKLDLDPWKDAAEDYFDWTLEKEEKTREEEKHSKDLDELNEKLRLANELGRERMKELQKKERELALLTTNLQKEKEAPADHKIQKPSQPTGSGEVNREIIARLRNHVEELKSDIRQRQEDNRLLRRQLQEERVRLAAQAGESSARPGTSNPSGEDEGAPLTFGRTPGKILVPVYSDAFLEACELMPSPVVAKALRSAADFAARNETIWHQTRRIERLSDIYRIRIDLPHRLLILWKENVELKVLDLILRRDLENWIKQYTRSSVRG